MWWFGGTTTSKVSKVSLCATIPPPPWVVDLCIPAYQSTIEFGEQMKLNMKYNSRYGDRVQFLR